MGSDSQTSEFIISEAIESARGKIIGTVVAANVGDEDVHMKDEEDEDCVQVAHEEEEVIIITPFEEAIMAANEVLTSIEE